VMQKQRHREAVDRDREKRAREARKARRELTKASSAGEGEDFLDAPLQDLKKDRKMKAKGSWISQEEHKPKYNNSSGRRWVRFACEKHRREHSRCPDNCPMRRKYSESDVTVEDYHTNTANGITAQMQELAMNDNTVVDMADTTP